MTSVKLKLFRVVADFDEPGAIMTKELWAKHQEDAIHKAKVAIEQDYGLKVVCSVARYYAKEITQERRSDA